MSATLIYRLPLRALLDVSSFLARQPDEWFMTAEITCAVDPQHRAVVRSALQLLAASGYVKTRRESRPNGIGGYDQWHRIAEPFTVELEVENAGTYIWKAWDVET